MSQIYRDILEYIKLYKIPSYYIKLDRLDCQWTPVSANLEVTNLLEYTAVKVHRREIKSAEKSRDQKVDIKEDRANERPAGQISCRNCMIMQRRNLRPSWKISLTTVYQFLYMTWGEGRPFKCHKVYITIISDLKKLQNELRKFWKNLNCDKSP